MSYPTYLVHFNPNHDKLGRFTFAKNSSGTSVLQMKNIATNIKNQVEKDKKEPTGNQNCQLCTWSAEAQFRGMTDAKPRPVYSPRDPALSIRGETIVKNPTNVKISDFADVNKKIDSIDGDARFYVHVNWKNSTGGHEFLVIKSGNNKYVMDPQVGYTAPLSDKSEYFSGINYNNSYISRLDNKEFNTSLYKKVNDRKNVMEFDPKLDIPYMYKEGMISKEEYEKTMGELQHSFLMHFNPNHDPKTGRFTYSKNQTMESKLRNYNKVIDSLSDEEYKLFTYDGGDRKEDKKFMREYTKLLPNYKDSRVFVSKYGNVTLASLEVNGLGDSEWNIGWATNPKNRGTGVTQANIKEAISFIRKYSDVPIGAIIEEDNIASRKTAEKAGFKDAGYTRMDDGHVMKRYIYD